jgi:hypothetical protein
MTDHILDVDLPAFERGSGQHRRAVVDGVRRRLDTGFVYTSHDGPEDLLHTAWGTLGPQRFAALSAADALDEVLYEINLVDGARRVAS